MEKAKVVSGLLAMLAAARANLAKYEGDERAMRAGLKMIAELEATALAAARLMELEGA
jgi:hypothetical protein